jgi:carboxylate-amine ligase
MADPLREPRFGAEKPFALGVEEELFLVDPRDGTQVNAREHVLGAIGAVERGEVTGEVHACQVELITDVCETAADAVEVLAGLRRAVLATGVGVLGSATHPTADEGAAEVSDKERYRFIAEQLGDALITPVASVHVHVGMSDADTAIRTFNGLRRHLPLFEALGANAPFRHGRDTGFASAREIVLRGWARSGTPRQMADYDDFATYAERLTRAAAVPDYTFHWWKLRAHPRLGTVEVRALDAQSSPTHVAALVALVHALARHEATADPVPGPSPEILEEGSYRAGRSGVDAELPDPDGTLRPVADVLEEALALARPVAGELGCAAELARLPDLVAAGGGAGMQRADHARGGLDAVLGGLLERTRGAAG